MQPKKYLLRKDEVSCFRNKSGRHEIYGKKGGIVIEVSDHIEVLIVKDKQGKCFPVLKSNLQII